MHLITFLISQWRVAALSDQADARASSEGLVAFCAAGCAARIAAGAAEDNA